LWVDANESVNKTEEEEEEEETRENMMMPMQMTKKME
jgi:hypothetical protein